MASEGLNNVICLQTVKVSKSYSILQHNAWIGSLYHGNIHSEWYHSPGLHCPVKWPLHTDRWNLLLSIGITEYQTILLSICLAATIPNNPATTFDLICTTVPFTILMNIYIIWLIKPDLQVWECSLDHCCQHWSVHHIHHVQQFSEITTQPVKSCSKSS